MLVHVPILPIIMLLFFLANAASAMSRCAPEAAPLLCEKKCGEHHRMPGELARCVRLHEQEHASTSPPSASPSSPASAEAATLTWVYTMATNTVSIAYTDTALSESGWIGWGINLHGTSMRDADVLIGFQQPSAGPRLRRYKLTAALYSEPAPLKPTATLLPEDGIRILPNMSLVVRTVRVSNRSSSSSSSGGGGGRGGGVSFTILATLLLPPGLSSINTIYNRGPSVMAPDMPAPHSPGHGQRNGRRTIHLTTGLVASGEGDPGTADILFLLKYVHAALAIAAWGFLLLLGAITARYMRRAEGLEVSSAWFSAHVWVQTMGYLLGAIAWALGVKLGSLSPGVVHRSHRSLGMAMVVLASLQVAAALFARPRRSILRHRRRLLWEALHHANGYALLLLAVVNIFKGFAILAPPAKYRATYIAFVALVSCTCIACEARAWLRLLWALSQRWSGLKPTTTTTTTTTTP